jgi:hypothetical protein
MVYKLIDNAHDHGQSYVFFIVDIIEQTIHIPYGNKDKAGKAKGTGIEHSHKESRSEPVDHARKTPMNKAY